MNTIGTEWLTAADELLALKWRDIDFFNSRLTVERAIVNQFVGDTKTAGSNRTITLSLELLQAMSSWRTQSGFRGQEDWVFASPTRMGTLPISFTCYRDALQTASVKVGIGKIGTHSLRHSYRTWLGEQGTDLNVQRQLMRHTDLRTTLSYGQTDSAAMVEANNRVAQRVFRDFKLIPSSVTH